MSGSAFYEDHRFYDQESTFDHDPFSMETDSFQDKNNNNNGEYNNSNGLVELKKINNQQIQLLQQQQLSHSNNSSFGIYYQQPPFSSNNSNNVQNILTNNSNNGNISQQHVQSQQIQNNIAINQFQNNNEVDIQQHPSLQPSSHQNIQIQHNIFHPVPVNMQQQGGFLPQDTHLNLPNQSMQLGLGSAAAGANGIQSSSMKRELVNTLHYQTTTTTTTTTNGYYQTTNNQHPSGIDGNGAYFIPTASNAWIPGDIPKSQISSVPLYGPPPGNPYAVSSPQMISNGRGGLIPTPNSSAPGTPVSLISNAFIDQFSPGTASSSPISPNAISTTPTSPTASKKSKSSTASGHRRGKVSKQDSLDNLTVSIPKQSIKDSKKSNSSPNLKKQILSNLKMSLIPSDSRSLIPGGDDLNSSTDSFGSDFEGIKSPRSPRTSSKHQHHSKMTVSKSLSSNSINSNNNISSPSLNSSQSSLLTPTMSGLSLSTSGGLSFSPLVSQNPSLLSLDNSSGNIETSSLSGSTGFQFTGQSNTPLPFSPQILNGFFTKDQDLQKKLKESLLPDQPLTLEQEIQNLQKVISTLGESTRMEIMNSLQELNFDSQNFYYNTDANSNVAKKVINFYILRLMMLINPTAEIPIPLPSNQFTPDENDEDSLLDEDEEDENNTSIDNDINNSSNSISNSNNNSNLFEESCNSSSEEFSRSKKLKICNIENDCINKSNSSSSNSLNNSSNSSFTKTNRNKKISKVNSTNSINTLNIQNPINNNNNNNNYNNNGLFNGSIAGSNSTSSSTLNNQMYNPPQSPPSSNSSYVYNPYGISTTTSINTPPPSISNIIQHHPLQRHNSLPSIFNANNTTPQLTPPQNNNNNNNSFENGMEVESGNESSSPSSKVVKKRRSSFTDHQTKVLNDHFNDKTSGSNENHKFTTDEIQQIAYEIGLTDNQVKVYFQNRRARKNKLQKQQLLSPVNSSNIPPSSTISSIQQENINGHHTSSPSYSNSSPSSDEY